MTKERLPAENVGRAAQLQRAFARLTPKQHEVLRFVSENRTSKEIAWELGISESAVNQRIESIRARAGSPPRAELARVYRQYQAEIDAACNSLTANNLQLPDAAGFDDRSAQDDPAESFALADAALAEPYAIRLKAPWQEADFERIVPEVLDGKHAGLNRTAAIIAISGGMLVIAMIGLSVVQALNGLM
ncbi:helix-turn-helix domain-containing protein [Novosphingobium colocasiae]|uniref:HTH luxR-type domain-containing protein n=1 Tax=Novosphingobium colocasiae TaxID=1256513 RepID=A0A918PH58_9SPHN|nr:helix-turn-helix transcriptional regulator [Novosphingobium colocasiae]GGZ09075.1 hypothetical protein GCM10011614_25020 [Novosphingobium colocasiae]